MFIADGVTGWPPVTQEVRYMNKERAIPTGMVLFVCKILSVTIVLARWWGKSMKAIMRDAAELKDSGIGYLGYIPQNWQLASAKFFVSISNGSDPKTDGETPVYGSGKGSFRTCGESKDGPTVLLGRKGTVDIPQYIEGKYWNVDTAFDVKAKYGYSLRFFYYLSTCFDYKRYSTQTALPSMTQSNYNSMRIVVPSFSEQNSIYEYLDDRCSKIDAIIAEAKASIEEYKELKQAVITQAVTLGIKKNRPLKDTNILWIGKTPCDWQLAELKFFASIKSGITLGQKYPAGAKLVEMPYLRVANVQGEYVDLSDVKTIQVLPEEVDKYRLEAGVVLMTEGGDRDKLGRGCVWHGEITPCLHQNHIFALTTKSDKLLPEYFSHVTTSEVARCYFDYTAKKTTNLANTNSSTIMNFRLPIPPLEEQREIVQYLDKRIKTLNDMISEKQSLIEDLGAYKKSLIYEVVTGKRKVVA